MAEPGDAIRLDIWLFRTRLIKSRSLATKLILGGKVRVTKNGKTTRTIKPHVTVRSGDIITFMRGEDLIHVEMLSPGVRRGPASEARTLYAQLPFDTDRDNTNG